MRSLLVCALVVCLPGAVFAQAVQRPTRPYRGIFGGGPPPDPNRTRQELTLTAGLLGGYDDYLVPGSESGPILPTQVGESAFSISVDAGMHYWYGRALRSVSIDVRAFSSAYRNAGIDPTIGVDLVVSGTSDLGRKSNIDATQTVTYSPTLVTGAFSPLAGDVDFQALPESGAGTGLVEQRSWATNTSVSVDRRWTPRQTTTGALSFSQRTYLNQLGYDSTSYSAGAGHDWNLNRTVSMGGSYNYSDTTLEETTGGTMPVTDHAFEVTASYRRRVSPTRQFEISGGLGRTYVQTLTVLEREPLTYWLPTGHATFRLDIGRSWALAGDYQRSVSVLQGVTLESFATGAASVRADGTLSRHIEAALSTAFSNGTAGAAGQTGSFQSFGGIAQIRYAVTRWCAVSVNYDYYRYKLRDIVAPPTGLPPEYDRNAIRVGLAFWLPLYGSYRGGERSSRGGS